MNTPFGIRNSVFRICPVPPKGNANFAWVQHFIHHLAPQTALRDSAFLQREALPQVVSEAKDNMAGRCEVGTTNFELQSSRVINSPFRIQHSSFSPSSNQSGEGDPAKRDRALIEADREMPSDELRTTNRSLPTSTFEIDALRFPPGSFQSSVSLRSAHPSNFASIDIRNSKFEISSVPVCLWFLSKNKNADAKRGFRDRRKQTLFIDARKLGTLIDRVHRELTDGDGMRRRFLSRENESTITLAA